MMDAKEPEVIEYLRQEARDGSVFLYNVRGGVACAISVILDEFTTLTRERDEARKDTARLDCLIAMVDRSRGGVELERVGRMMTVCVLQDHGATHSDLVEARSFREALDCAIRDAALTQGDA
jgi:hypothetical protein